jgi:hypothetical protein
VREVFEEIRERGPMVVCFDHIEAIALSRDVSSDIGRMVALRQLLLELPKMSDTDSVVIGTTADLDSLDYAVLKPGRFSRKWYIEMPEESARREIISRNIENRKTAPSSRCPRRPLPPVTFLSRYSRRSDGRPPVGSVRAQFRGLHLGEFVGVNRLPLTGSAFQRLEVLDNLFLCVLPRFECDERTSDATAASTERQPWQRDLASPR